MNSLFTAEIDKQLFEQFKYGSDIENQMVVAKIFNPYGRGTWYLLNSDPNDPDYIWCISEILDIGVGSVSRSELESVRVKPYRLPLERDIHFQPINAMELYNGLREGKKYAKGGKTEAPKLERVRIKPEYSDQTVTAYKSIHEPNVLYYAMKNEDDIGDVESYIVMARTDAGDTEANDDWFSTKAEADHIARELALGTYDDPYAPELYAKGGNTDHWIQGAIKHKGALRRKAKAMGLIKGDETLSEADLHKLEKIKGRTAKEAHLAETLSKFKSGGQVEHSADKIFDGIMADMHVKKIEYDEAWEYLQEPVLCSAELLHEKFNVDLVNADITGNVDKKNPYYSAFNKLSKSQLLHLYDKLVNAIDELNSKAYND